MNRLSILLFCTSVFLLSGCPIHAALTKAEAAGQTWISIYTENPPRFEIQQDIKIQEVGYIDDNTWYFATDEFKGDGSPKDASANTWQIRPLREMHQYHWGGFSGRPAFVNQNHITHDRKMLNWHDGSTCDVAITHIGTFDYTLMPDSQKLIVFDLDTARFGGTSGYSSDTVNTTKERS